MNGFVLFFVLIVFVIVLARVMKKLFPPDYHQSVEDKYNDIDK